MCDLVVLGTQREREREMSKQKGTVSEVEGRKAREGMGWEGRGGIGMLVAHRNAGGDGPTPPHARPSARNLRRFVCMRI